MKTTWGGGGGKPTVYVTGKPDRTLKPQIAGSLSINATLPFEHQAIPFIAPFRIAPFLTQCSHARVGMSIARVVVGEMVK